MASVSNIMLAVTDDAATNTSKVTVKGVMHFDAAEVGKSYRLEIKIFGEDRLGDNLPATDPVPVINPLGDDELYPFSWGSLFNQKPYWQFVVASAGDRAFTETRILSSATLDEDSGGVFIPQNNRPFLAARKDEVYAQVLLSGVPVSARSTTVTLGFGV